MSQAPSFLDSLGGGQFVTLAECSVRLRELHSIANTPEVKFITSSHMVRYFVNDFWSVLDEDWQKSLLELSDVSLAVLPNAVFPEDCESESLSAFVTRIRNAILPRSQSAVAGFLVNNQPGYFIDHQMSPKKSHEVQLMAALVAAVAKEQGVEQVVDVGSGKGYLSETLALQHHLTVVGVDACETNVHGAEKRTNLLRRYYTGLVRRAERLHREKEDQVAAVTASATAAAAGEVGCDSASAGGSVPAECCTESKDGGRSLPACPLAHCDPCQASARSSRTSSEQHEQHTAQSCSSEAAVVATVSYSSEAAVVATVSCSTEAAVVATELCSNEAAVMASHAEPTAEERTESDSTSSERHSDPVPTHSAPPSLSESPPAASAGAATHTRVNKRDFGTPSHMPVSGYVRHDEDDFMAFLAERSEGRIAMEKPLVLTGLHACGNLSSTSLRLFAHCPNLRILCSVGCCYHLLTESEEAERAHSDGSVEDRAYKITPRPDWRGKGGEGPLGFPLSKLAEELEPQMGINARMLACQAPDRMCAGEPPSHHGIFWRALFQVMLIEKFQRSNDSRRNNVGRQVAKSKTFRDYVHRCMRKLEIDESLITDEEISEYLHRFEGRQRQLQCFAQLRAMVSAVTESLIIVDRIHFLLEQPDVSAACAIPLFDPVTSPRNLVLLAIKKPPSLDER